MGSDRGDEGVIRRALADAGYVADSAPLLPGFRSWRWLAHLPEGRIAFFADSPEAVARLGREREASRTIFQAALVLIRLRSA